MLVLCVQDNLVQGLAATGGTQAITNILAIEHAGDLAEQFKVRIGGGFWHQQDKQQVHRCAVDGVEINGGGEVEQGTYRALATLETAMWNCNAIAKSS